MYSLGTCAKSSDTQWLQMASYAMQSASASDLQEMGVHFREKDQAQPKLRL
jgi:hypothetical protein